MYAHVCTRPDIVYVLGFLMVLVRSQNGPLEGCKQSCEISAKNRKFHACVQQCDELEIIGYVDPDFVGSPIDIKSTSGYVFKLDDGAIS